jgi:hypothetical protein
MLLVVVAAPAAARDRVLVRWLPAAGGPVDGYVVQFRHANEPVYTRQRNVGLPAPNPDGSLQVVIDGLDAAGSWVFAVSAYGAHGWRSPRSNERALLPRIGLCAARDEGERCDPCIAGACAGGACIVAEARAPVPGTGLSVRLQASRTRLRAAGTFVPLGSVDPQAAGLTLELIAADGAVVHRAELSPDAFRVGRRGGEFRYAAGSVSPGGVRRLVVRQQGGVMTVRVRARVSLSLADAVEPLTWIVHVGSWCARQLDLRCAVLGPRIRCN